MVLANYKIRSYTYRESPSIRSWQNRSRESREGYYYRLGDYNPSLRIQPLMFRVELGEEDLKTSPIYLELVMDANFYVLDEGVAREDIEEALRESYIDHYLMAYARNHISNLTDYSFSYTAYFIGYRATNLIRLD